MKPKKMVLLFLILAVVSGAICISPLILYFASGQIKNVFIGSTVRIQGVKVNPFGFAGFSEVDIKLPGVYDLRLLDSKISFNLISLLLGKINKIDLKELNINITTPKSGIASFIGNIHLKQGKAFLIDNIEIDLINFNVHAQDADIQGYIKANVSPADKKINRVEADFKSIDAGEMKLKDLKFVFEQQIEGVFSIGSVKYNKVNVSGVKAKTRLIGSDANVKGLTADLWDGRVDSDIELHMAEPVTYSADIRCSQINLESFVSAFELKEKFQLTGLLNGSAQVKGKQAELTVLGGDFSVDEPGGKLIITDTKFLENIAKRGKQAMEIIMDGFKNYRYNIGIMKVSYDSGNLIMDIALDGKEGKRNLTIVLHSVL